MKTIENVSKIFVLGESGAKVECMLLDSIEEIKVKNTTLTENDLQVVSDLLKQEIENKLKEQNNKNEPTTED